MILDKTEVVEKEKMLWIVNFTK